MRLKLKKGLHVKITYGEGEGSANKYNEPLLIYR